jgi:hypothetical protein
MTIPFSRRRGRPAVAAAAVAEAELLRLWILSLPTGQPLPPTNGEQ